MATESSGNCSREVVVRAGMDQIQCLPRILAGLLLTIVISVVACSGASGPTGSLTASPVPTVGGPVTTPEDAVARVVAHEPRFAGINKRDPDMIGQASWYEVAPASGVGGFVVRVRVGWGDCPSGCIDEHTWVYAVAPDGTVTLQSEEGDPLPSDALPAPGGGGGGSS
jgi:hypothetical protein